MKKAFQIGLMALFLFSGTLAGAHSLWFNVDDHQYDVGKPVTLDLCWGHMFPEASAIKEGMLNEAVAIDSEGKRTPLKQISQIQFEFVPEAKGAYLLSASIHPGFVTKTTEGYKMGPKSSFEQVVSCFHYNLCAKTCVYAGDRSETPVQAAGHPLELIPKANLFDLERGADLPIKVLFNGKPLADATLKATYAGFSDQPNTFATTVKTDQKGVARVKLVEKGKWFFTVTHEIPYTDKKECDTEKYNATITFDVK